MSDTKHTPGLRYADKAETIANARLIAAAPELLAALRAMVDVADRANYPSREWTNTRNEARIAIAKATGE